MRNISNASEAHSHMKDAVLQQRKMHYLVRRWVTEETDLRDVMNHFNLKFYDIGIEEQFNYYYLHIHSPHVRFLILILILGLAAAAPLTSYNLYLRIPSALLLGFALYFSDTEKMDRIFWVADWGLGVVFFLGSLSLSAMLAFDEVLNPKR